MNRTHASTLTSLTAIAMVLTSAIAQAQAQPQDEPLPPLQPPPAAEPAPTPPAAEPAPWVQAPGPAPAEPAAKPARRRGAPIPSATPPQPPIDLARVEWRRWQSPVEAPEPPAPPPSKTFAQLSAGIRSSLVPDHVFGAFSDNKAFTQVGVAASYTVAVAGPISFAPGLSWDYGGSSSTVRGDPSELTMHRFSVRLEGRYHVLPWMYAFARVAPGALRQSLKVEDMFAPAPLTQASWVASADLSGGAAFLVVPHGAQSPRSPRLWAEIDGGYGWAGTKQVSLLPDLPSNDARRVGPVDLGEMTLRGGFVRVALSLTY